MKKLLTILFITISTLSYADQLAYISKADADRAVAKIEKMKSIYLFCGCCSLKEPEKVQPIKVYMKHTGYEEYWEVYIQYLDEDGITRDIPLDLAYVWKKKLFGYKTIGDVLKLEHDYCVKPKDWDNPKKQEKDI
ncbi:MAG: hypothetical protein P8P74_03900 [Crocinitomicaceae bacterium]|nr:hypothetical protein [Crocinitomicaceae bacterium]